MVKTGNSWLSSPRDTGQSPDFSSVRTSTEPLQPGYMLASMSPSSCTNMMMSGVVDSTIPSLRAHKSHGAQGLPQSTPPHFRNSLPAGDPYLKQNASMLSYEFAGNPALNAVPGCQRKFVIFDHSGNETRLIYSSFLASAVKPNVDAIKPIGGSYLHREEHAAKIDRINLTVPNWQEVSDENHSSAEESEMHEDTEEINALLYSDDDDYDGDSDDEVTSTDHSPALITSSEKQEQVEEITEEVADSDGQNKRQKLLSGVYRRSSTENNINSTKVTRVHGYDYDDSESSYAIGYNRDECRFAIIGNNKTKKDKIRATVKFLETIIPGAKDKDPLLVLDVAIGYLKSLKLKAKTLGVNYSLNFNS
ncbi:transcription factor bHLH143-like isoform X1 [Mercurialis annua]|uniref:transcription factor bHLH143-like isoform X1 n=1 Tax=Mercurialis annua TaxID=3986 RepID=UPI00215E9D10|nr:transcription factor bHLH143-like isoform X1 [Mercurialis annua]